jgi:hypothetical protein
MKNVMAFAVVTLSLAVVGCNKPIKQTVECTGNDQITLKGKTFTVADGPAIDASGNCHLTCKDCTITGAEGIHAAGNAQITLEGGSLTASATALDLSGNASVKAAGTPVVGEVKKSGNAKVDGVAGGAAAASAAKK